MQYNALIHNSRLIPLLFTALAAPAFGQGLSEETAQRTIIVSGHGLQETPATPAYGTQHLDRTQLVSTGSGRIEDALASVAGFQQFRRSDSRSSNPSAQGATLRALGGNASSRALVLLDGVPMADPFFGFIPFSAIAPERLASARVTRGGGSGPFGAGALAGTIELTSADAAALGPASGHLLANDRGETEAGATIASTLGGGFVAVSGRWDRGKGFYTTPSSMRVPASARAAYDSWSVQLRAVAPLNDVVEVQARALVYDDNRTLRFSGADNSHEGQDASVRIVGRGDWQFELLGYIQARNFSNIVISSTRFVPVLDQRNTPSTGIGGKLELRPPVGQAHVLRVGSDYRRAQGEMYETALSAFTGNVSAFRNAGGTITDLGFFIEDDWTSGPLTLTAGARADRYTIRDGFFMEHDGAGASITDDRFSDRTGWATSFRGGATVRLSENIHVRGAAYTGLRLPTLNELYRPFVIFPVRTQANPALRNERLEGYEAGVELILDEKARLSLTAFDNRIKNAISNVTIGTNLRQRRNIGAIHARGVEFNTSVNLAPVQFNGALAYTNAKVEDGGLAAAQDGKRPAQTPRWVGSATLSYQPAEQWQLAATLRHVSAQFEDDQETDVLPAATTFDAYIEVPLSMKLALVLRGENLTGETVVTRNQSGSMDVGTPRTLWAGFKLSL